MLSLVIWHMVSFRTKTNDRPKAAVGEDLVLLFDMERQALPAWANKHRRTAIGIVQRTGNRADQLLVEANKA